MAVGERLRWRVSRALMLSLIDNNAVYHPRVVFRCGVELALGSFEEAASDCLLYWDRLSS
jgi:hypothetical protein